MWYTKCVIMWDAKCVIVLQNFDRYHCCQLVLECLCQYDDASVIQMSIAICGILAAKVNTLIYLDIDGAWRTCVWPLSICQFVNTCNLGLRDHVTPALNRFCTEQGHCGAYRRKWRLTDTDVCLCGETQTMSHIVKSCPWQNWLAAYLGCNLWTKTLFHGWPVMVHDTHTRRRRTVEWCVVNYCAAGSKPI